MVLKMEIQSPSTSHFPAPQTPFIEPLEWRVPLLPLSPPVPLSTSAESDKSVNLLVPGKVVASGPIPQGSMTINIEPWTLRGQMDNKTISVRVTSFGTLDLDKKSKSLWTEETHWIRAIKLADDCHTYNVQLKFQPSYRLYPNLRGTENQPKLILQAVRPIEAGQELQLWFSEDILATLHIVFLSPSNIQGQKKYTCSRCNASYESPNPLKLHITLKCGKFPISALWDRLVSLIQGASPLEDFEFKLTPEPQNFKQGGNNVLDLSKKVEPSSKVAYNSAFKPFKREELEINSNNTLPLNLRPIHELPTLWPVTFGTDVLQLHRNLMHSQAMNNAQNDAQIESLVSSLGKAKQGHVCLYCGKCYSRKYGLKIHIRTHTGYKPLKCKYCERPFGDPSNLNKHVRLHAEGNTPYKCDICGKILVRRRDLERHLKSRHMADIHPGQNILPESPKNNENSNSATENSGNTQKSNEDVSFLSSEKFEDSHLNEVKIIEISKDSDGETGIC